MNGDNGNVLAAIASGILGLALIAAMWVPPIMLGIKWARRKGLSPHWMWFGVHPLTGWIAFWIIRYKITPRRACGSCASFVPSDARFCPNCKTELSAAAVTASDGGDGKPTFRWFTNTVSCAKCHAWVKLNASFCTQCSTPAPKLVCPSCQSTNTTLHGQNRALISGIVAIVFSVSFFNSLQLALQRSQVFRYTKSLGQALTLEMLIYLGGSLILLALGAAFLCGSFGTTAKRVSCNACGRKTPLLSRTPEVSAATSESTPAVERPASA
jgi:hypothetical protein